MSRRQPIVAGESAGAIPIIEPNMTLVVNRRVALRLGITFPASASIIN
jgi:hypothetical protein